MAAEASASMAAEASSSSVTVKKVISHAASSLGYELKKQQEKSIYHFVKGKDVFVSLPTGFGKSLCYTLLPRVFDLLRGVEKQSIALVISPLIALMEDQVTSINSLGSSAAYVSDKHSTDRAVRRKIKKGGYQVIFMSPEALLQY